MNTHEKNNQHHIHHTINVTNDDNIKQKEHINNHSMHIHSININNNNNNMNNTKLILIIL